MKTSARIIIILFFAAIGLGTAFKLNSIKKLRKAESVLISKAKSEVPVTVVNVTVGSTLNEITYHGNFEPNYEITVISEAQGKVVNCSIEEGCFISEGKTIAVLENDILSYQLEASQAQYEKAKIDQVRFENLAPGEAISVQQLEEARLAVKNAKSSYLTIKKQYDNTFIKAPVSGIVGKRYFEPGAFIGQGTAVAEIIDTRKMKFIAWFNAADIVRVKAGQHAKIKSELYNDVTYEGVFRVIGIKPDEAKRYRVQVEVINNTLLPIIPGTNGTLNIQPEQDKNSIIVPANCVIDAENQPAVYVVEAGKAKLRPVIISAMMNDQVVISDGLSEGEQVVLTGHINLQDNINVKVLDQTSL